jgi:hypothetical protein
VDVNGLTVVRTTVFCTQTAQGHKYIPVGYDFGDATEHNRNKKRQHEIDHAQPVPEGGIIIDTKLRRDEGRQEPLCKAEVQKRHTIHHVSSFHTDGETLVYGAAADKQKVVETVAIIKAKHASVSAEEWERARRNVAAQSPGNGIPDRPASGNLRGRHKRRAQQFRKQ